MFTALTGTDDLGLTGPRIFVEVKHRSKSTEAQDIRSFLGGGAQETVVFMLAPADSLRMRDTKQTARRFP